MLITFLELHYDSSSSRFVDHITMLTLPDRENFLTDTECPIQLLPILSVCQASEGEITGSRTGPRHEETCLAE